MGRIIPKDKVNEFFGFFPINREHLSHFEKDNVAKKIDKDFNYLEIIPQNSIEIIRKTVNN